MRRREAERRAELLRTELDCERKREGKTGVGDCEHVARSHQLAKRLLEVGPRRLLELWRSLQIEILGSERDGGTANLASSRI